MTERHQIFSRIRQALQAPAPRPGAAHHGPPSGGYTLPGNADFQRVLPVTGGTFEEKLALFARHSAELKTDFRPVPDLEGVRVELARLRDAAGWQRVATHDAELTGAVGAALGLPMHRQGARTSEDAAALEQCDVGITECDALIAQTGSVLVTTRSAGGRALSVLPPHHVVLARREQLLPGLPDAFALMRAKYGADYPSMMSFITGPSRTGDIERILVLGAHGPRQLTVFLLTEAADGGSARL